MSFLDRLNPLKAARNTVGTTVADATHTAFTAAAEDLAKLSPELADLLAGQEVELVITPEPIRFKVQLRQKGES